MSRSPKLSLGLRNKSFLDIVTTSSWPPPLPQESASSPKANLGEGNEDDIGLLVDQSDPALEHLDRAYSESYKLHLSLKECRALLVTRSSSTTRSRAHSFLSIPMRPHVYVS